MMTTLLDFSSEDVLIPASVPRWAAARDLAAASRVILTDREPVGVEETSVCATAHPGEVGR